MRNLNLFMYILFCMLCHAVCFWVFFFVLYSFPIPLCFFFPWEVVCGLLRITGMRFTWFLFTDFHALSTCCWQHSFARWLWTNTVCLGSLWHSCLHRLSLYLLPLFLYAPHSTSVTWGNCGSEFIKPVVYTCSEPENSQSHSSGFGDPEHRLWALLWLTRFLKRAPSVGGDWSVDTGDLRYATEWMKNKRFWFKHVVSINDEY